MTERQSGFISWIILAIIALALLKYFLNWDIFDAASSDQGQSTIGYIRALLDTIWSYIEAPVKFAWNEIVMPLMRLFWMSLQAFLEWGRDNASSFNS